MIMKRFSLLRNYVARLPVDDRLRQLKALLPTIGKKTKSDAKLVLVQVVADPYYLSLFSVILCEMGKGSEITPELLVFRSIESEMGYGIRASLKRSFPYIWLTSRQWIRMYEGVSSVVGYRSVSWAYPVEDTLAYLKAHSIWRSLATLKCLEQLVISNIKCGDLILDTYLRFKPAATVNLKDPFLRYLIWQAKRDIFRAKRYFEGARPKLFLSSYSVYIQHGIAARVALAYGIKVVTFGNHLQLGKTLSSDDFFHTKNAQNYRRDFLQCEESEQRLSAARAQLETRLSGGIDDATSYMATSAYAESSVACPDVRGAVVVYLHDFFDSPHIYADLVFPDFWTWISFTIETLQAAEIPFFLKRHPNQIALSEDVVVDLSKKYNNLLFVPNGVTTRELALAGMACAVTMYGTIVHEAAYLGVPSIACARHPHAAYDFCNTAKTLTEYESLLRKANALVLADKQTVKKEVLEFYVMHNLDLPSDQFKARAYLLKLWGIAHAAQSSAQEIADVTNALADDPGFKSFVRGLLP
jgi:hypothetical protein